MDKKELKEFLDGAKYYIESLKSCAHETCPLCGMKAESFEKIVEEITNNSPL